MVIDYSYGPSRVSRYPCAEYACDVHMGADDSYREESLHGNYFPFVFSEFRFVQLKIQPDKQEHLIR